MKPELLLPVGNPEAFYAALEGGADSVYLGLKSFNARGKALNFTIDQLQVLVKKATNEKIKVYLTLNTLIKNNELPELLNILYQISQIKISAIIIQDLGVLHLLHKYHDSIPLFASTQMTVHNSAGCKFFHNLGMQRIILARELTLKELEHISRSSGVELELFIHGALCYSVSGLCLFSSYMGGMSANRGLCCQPCRRAYRQLDKDGYLFSLRDLQLIDLVPYLCKLGIKSLKIEGRMKSAEYVYITARAYRMVIDDPARLPEARDILKNDLSREKIQYFLGKNLQKPFTEIPYTGQVIGRVGKRNKDSFTFTTSTLLNIQDRLRLLSQGDEDARSFKIVQMQEQGQPVTRAQAGNEVTIFTQEVKARINDQVILTGRSQKKFPHRFPEHRQKINYRLSQKKISNILQKTGSGKICTSSELFIRISTLRWIQKLNWDKFHYLILNLQKKDWENLNPSNYTLKKNRHRIILQLPRFIMESDLEYYRQLCLAFYRSGFHQFMLSHISQKDLLPRTAKIHISTAENIYVLNDAAIQFLKEHDVELYVYPLENDRKNLLAGKDRRGIVPLFYYPELFYSRVPIRSCRDSIINSKELKLRCFRIQGLTSLVPELPVSWLHHKNELYKAGFRRFLLDLSYQLPSQYLIHSLIEAYQKSRPIARYSQFNWDAGLK